MLSTFTNQDKNKIRKSIANKLNNLHTDQSKTVTEMSLECIYENVSQDVTFGQIDLEK